MNRYADWPIARQITSAAALLVLAGFLAVALFLAQSNRAQTLEDIDEELIKDTRLMVRVLDAYFENVKARVTGSSAGRATPSMYLPSFFSSVAAR
jgi:hypothetical protein